MSDLISLWLPQCDNQRLDRVSELTGRSPDSYVREALRKYLDDFEYVSTIRAEVEAVRKGELKAISLEELEREFEC
ncbi:type II toxin-antitoxin system RelB family antitoxin [Corynebacterium spheniscorum]|uniref:RHH-type transcriptional regulator, rel operon repressor / antitoxin RelB n=1 Tax=Corynebacterium spheniscorum TaxID=185761 RepID=A0A1I2UGV7_9CORY|nr:hypothetical protein [Corynebacterium spheniscorum]KAA8720788.1 peptidylprolyl isomerase [Corynebacterium spheniscorum]SFG73971.1 RHH-type transcriptional regulator, rel operon repressor / antitoxin RelB [Corynebacterium spheniscorum]